MVADWSLLTIMIGLNESIHSDSAASRVRNGSGSFQLPVGWDSPDRAKMMLFRFTYQQSNGLRADASCLVATPKANALPDSYDTIRPLYERAHVRRLQLRRG